MAKLGFDGDLRRYKRIGV